MSRALVAAALSLALLACKETPPPPEPAKPAPAAKPAGPPAPLTPDQVATAQLAVRNNCLACHGQEMLDQQRLTPAQWSANVKKMQGWGAPLEPGEPELVVSYLAERSGPSAGTYGIPEVDAKLAAASLAPTPDGDLAGGDAARGEALYKSSCASCHGPDAKGERLGINLVDRPVLYRAADFAAVVTKGRNRMPETTGILKTDIAALLTYLRSLKG